VLLVLYKGIFPVLLLMIVKFYFITSLLKQKVHINQNNPLNYKVDFDSGLIIQLKGKNKYEEIEIIEKNLIYIHSEDNYICIYYLKNNLVHKEVFRTTLNEIEMQLSSFKNFYRCHRCYIINAMMVKGIVGNARSYKLIMDKVSEEIPLGMKYFNEISEIIHVIEKKVPLEAR
jgi:DNA-binding LytR/AlgR family response regulator